MRRGFFDLPDWIATAQHCGPRFTGVHVYESSRSRGKCFRCGRMIGKRGQSYEYVMKYLYRWERLDACKRCHRRLCRTR